MARHGSVDALKDVSDRDEVVQMRPSDTVLDERVAVQVSPSDDVDSVDNANGDGLANSEAGTDDALGSDAGEASLPAVASGEVDSVARSSTVDHARKRSRLRHFLKEYVSLAVGAIILASLVRGFLGQAYWIPSASMVPTLKVGDRVIVSRLSYRTGDPRRGDIAVFKNPDFVDRGRRDLLSRGLRDALEVVGLGQPKDKYFIKRVIGLPGDTIEVKERAVWVNGSKLDEPWLAATARTEWSPDMTYGGAPFRLPDKTYFMMGDNRAESRDSRYFGPIKRAELVGRASIRIWPLTRAGGL